MTSTEAQPARPGRPLRNRVTPFGEIVAVPHRGTMLGNRGRLHNAGQRLVRDSHLDRWICCRLEFRGRQRAVMGPRSYTELFFLDEATAFAAGHRPCSECRNRAYQHFRRAWRDAGLADEIPRAAQLDAVLAVDRRHRPSVDLDDLPDGVLVASGGTPYLWWNRQLRRWTWTGYHQPPEPPGERMVELLTPRATTRVLAAGYPVSVHASAAWA